MTTILSILFFVLTPLLVVCILLGRLTETRRQQIRRLKREGLSQRAIAARVGTTVYRVRLALA